MPIGKKSTTDSTLYALIIFVALFIIAATAAVIYYLKFEEQRGIADSAQKTRREVVNDNESQKIGSIVGNEQPGKSRLKAMAEYVDQSLGLIMPGVSIDTSAEVKVNEVTNKVRESVTAVVKQNPELSDTDPNITLLQLTEKLGSALKNTTDAQNATKGQLAELQGQFDDAKKVSMEKEKGLLAEKDKFEQQFNKVAADYNELKGLLEKKTDEQVKDLYAKLDQERTTKEETNKQLLKNQAELQTAQDRIQRILKESVWKINPPPDTMVEAFEADGKILLVDDQAKTVQLNLGLNDHVYRGLTFAVYDKGQPIPKDGKGKAEIEVYNVADSFSAARIIRSEKKNPIVAEDIIANIIWNYDKPNTFVIAGEFDLNNDNAAETEAASKIRGLIEKWGGNVTDAVNVNTDFVILGTMPVIPSKPTMQELERYPNAMENYEKAQQCLVLYNQIQNQAQIFSIPILNAERFLYFIGYKTQSGNPGAF